MSSGFLTEKEAAAAREKRQDEWERVRKETDPREAPVDQIMAPAESRKSSINFPNEKNIKKMTYFFLEVLTLIILVKKKGYLYREQAFIWRFEW